MIVQGDEPWAVSDAEGVEKFGGCAGVLAGDDSCRAEDFDEAGGRIAKVADRGCRENDHAHSLAGFLLGRLNE